MRRWLVPACTVLLAVTACSGGSESSSVSADGPARTVQVSGENIVRVENAELLTGPLISGEVSAAHSAEVRAEVAGTIVDVRIDEGQTVKHGDLLARIESEALADELSSARSAVRSANAALELARIEVRRSQELVVAGAIAQRDLDQARANLAAAEAQLANARAGLAMAEERFGNTFLRAPLSGIVSVRMADTGDVVTVGLELFTIIDPSSMRLEASVPSEQISELRLGYPVRYTISGYDKTLEGRIQRISPRADAVSRQVSVYVTIPRTSMPLAVGLFAEGRVVTRSAIGPVVPENAVNEEDAVPWVLRVHEGKAERVPVAIGLRDPLTERVLIRSGVREGDILLRGTDQAITPGTPLDISE
jgi:RND family efflux transporter MFP subunit